MVEGVRKARGWKVMILLEEEKKELMDPLKEQHFLFQLGLILGYIKSVGLNTHPSIENIEERPEIGGKYWNFQHTLHRVEQINNRDKKPGRLSTFL